MDHDSLYELVAPQDLVEEGLGACVDHYSRYWLVSPQDLVEEDLGCGCSFMIGVI